MRGKWLFGGIVGGAVASLALAAGDSVLSAAENNAPQKTTRRVDSQLRTEFQDASVKVAPPADDATYLRRVWLDLVGQPPAPKAILAFVHDTAANKRRRLVDTLLADERFGNNWAQYWTDVIFYRRSEERALIGARAATEYLATRFNDNDSWRDIAASFVTAEGDVREDGATAVIMAQAGRPEETVSELTRIFNGIQIQCAQCHDHPTDRWKREQFHHLAAFFPRVAVRPSRMGPQRTFLVVANNFPAFRRPNANNRFAGTLEHNMPDLNAPSAPGELMQPVFFVTGEKVKIGTDDAFRRGKLARWMTSDKNPWFANAFVNRVWSELVGEGFYEPVDDIGPDRECSSAATLAILADSFVASNYNVKNLYRTIMATEVYGRASGPRRTPIETPFAANCSQPLRDGQLYTSLFHALGLPDPATAAGRPGAGFRRQRGPRVLFKNVFGFDPSQRRDEVGGSIPQALTLMNSSQINRAIASREGTVSQLMHNTDDDREAITNLYLRVLARRPSKREIETCLAYRAESPSRLEAFQDMFWSLINTAEFKYRR